MPLSVMTITNFLLLGGPGVTTNPVANGRFDIRLNKDAMSPAGQVGTQVDAIDLDANGAPEGPPTFWPNSELSPNNTSYILKVFNAQGEQILYGPFGILVGPTVSATGFGSSFG